MAVPANTEALQSKRPRWSTMRQHPCRLIPALLAVLLVYSAYVPVSFVVDDILRRKIERFSSHIVGSRFGSSSMLYERRVRPNRYIRNDSRVIVWMPHTVRCSGQFLLFSNISDQESGTPALLIREAALDRRHVSLKEYRVNHSPERSFRRIVILVTAVPHGTSALVTKPVKKSKHGKLRDHSSAFVTKSGSVVDELRSGVDYVITDVHCARSCRDYTPCRNKEWQIIVTVTLRGGGGDSVLDSVLERLETQGASLRLKLPILMRDNSTEIFETTIGLGCIAGLTSVTALPVGPNLPRRQDDCNDAHGALAISGGPLFGQKRISSDSWREVAHYAARSLFGSIWFNTVAVGVLPEYTISEIHHICAAHRHTALCIRDYHERNSRHLENIAEAVQEVFIQLGIPTHEWSRLILFPFCRLGSDFLGRELRDPCKLSHHNGQKPLGHIAYTMFGPYHRWVSNLDLDEFVVKEESPGLISFLTSKPSDKLTRTLSAESQFDEMMAQTGETSFRMPWFDFRVTHQTMLDLSHAVTRGHQLDFGPYNLSAAEVYDKVSCYMGGNGSRELLWGGGKVAQHCKDGFGFMIHDPFNLWKATKTFRLDKADCTRRNPRFPPLHPVYTYHARLDSSRFGKCEYRPQLCNGTKCG